MIPGQRIAHMGAASNPPQEAPQCSLTARQRFGWVIPLPVIRALRAEQVMHVVNEFAPSTNIGQILTVGSEDGVPQFYGPFFDERDR